MTTYEQTARDRQRTIRAIPDTYAERDRAMAAMNLIDGLSKAEVARRIGVSDGTVRNAVKAYGPMLRAAARPAS